MKFCEKFHISPLDYARIPRKKIDLWWQMLSTENEIGRFQRKREEDKAKLLKPNAKR